MNQKAPDNAVAYIQKGQNVVNVNIVDEQSRILKFARRKQMLNDNFYPLVEKELGKVIVSADETGLIEQIDDTNNVFRLVMEELSKVYDQEPKREFSEDEIIQKDMDEKYDLMEITEILEQSNLYMNAFNDCLVQVGVNEAEDLYNLKLRTPENTIVKTGNDLELLEVYIYQGTNNQKDQDKLEIWYGYTAESAFQVEVATSNEVLDTSDDERKPQGSNKDMSNPLGFLPFIVLHNGFRDDCFWQNHKGDDLVKGNIQIAIKLTILNQLIKYQSFKQLVATSDGANANSLDDVVIDPASVIYLFGENSKIETLDLESNYKQLWDTTNEINNNLAINYGISPDSFKITSAPSSGFALMMQNIKVDRFIKKQQKYYAKKESEIFQMMRRFDEKLGNNIITADSVKTIMKEPAYPKTDKELLEEQEKLIEIGKDSMVKILMKEKGLAEEEAEKAYNENLKQRNKANEQFNTNGATANVPSVDLNIGR